jgi:hypothetical protein
MDLFRYRAIRRRCDFTAETLRRRGIGSKLKRASTGVEHDLSGKKRILAADERG